MHCAAWVRGSAGPTDDCPVSVIGSRIVADGERDQHRRFDTDEPVPPLVWDHFRGGLAGVVEATGASEVHVVDVVGAGEACFLELRVSW